MPTEMHLPKQPGEFKPPAGKGTGEKKVNNVEERGKENQRANVKTGN